MQTTQEATEGLLRFGHVQEYDASRHMARVIFPAMNGIISGWLPVLVSFTNGNKSESHLDIGSHVACIMAGEGAELGVILGTFYDDTNAPGTGNADITSLTFPDGTEIAYDRASHSLSVNCAGSITMKATGDIKIQGANIWLN